MDENLIVTFLSLMLQQSHKQPPHRHAKQLINKIILRANLTKNTLIVVQNKKGSRKYKPVKDIILLERYDMLCDLLSELIWHELKDCHGRLKFLKLHRKPAIGATSQLYLKQKYHLEDYGIMSKQKYQGINS